MAILTIQGKLAGLNDYTRACRSNRYIGAKMKADAEAKKAEYEATQAAKLAEQMAVEEQENVSKTEQVEPQIPQKKNWVRLAAFMTRDEAYELKKFFDDRAIEFKAI